jgi:hypothetical protein
VSSDRKTRITENSVELCQVGIEHARGAEGRNSVVSSEDRITEDSESSARRALSRVHRDTG